MPGVLEAFRTAAPRQLGLAGLATTDPGARRSERYAAEDTAQLCASSAEKADVAPDSGVILGQLHLAALMAANPAARRSGLCGKAKTGSPRPDVFEALCTARPPCSALLQGLSPRRRRRPGWVGEAG